MQVSLGLQLFFVALRLVLLSTHVESQEACLQANDCPAFTSCIFGRCKRSVFKRQVPGPGPLEKECLTDANCPTIRQQCFEGRCVWRPLR